MGLYDTVVVRCPKCEHRIEIQSKAGEQAMHTYSYYDSDIPESIVDDVADDILSCECGLKFRLVKINRPMLTLQIER